MSAIFLKMDPERMHKWYSSKISLESLAPAPTTLRKLPRWEEGASYHLPLRLLPGIQRCLGPGEPAVHRFHSNHHHLEANTSIPPVVLANRLT